MRNWILAALAGAFVAAASAAPLNDGCACGAN